MLKVTSRIAIAEEELLESFVRASGPGGQNVNKVATAVQLRFDVERSPSLPEEVRERLRKLAARRLTKEGVLIIEARRFRTQERNRRDAREKLVALIRRAATRPRARRPTRPSAEAERKRLETKRRRGVKKRERGRRPSHDD